jgi:hypothetical protein
VLQVGWFGDLQLCPQCSLLRMDERYRPVDPKLTAACWEESLSLFATATASTDEEGPLQSSITVIN